MRSLLPLTLGLAAIALTCALPSTAQVPPQVVIQRSGDTLGKAHTLNCSGSLECSLASGVATMSTSSNAGDPGVTCPPGYALTYDGSAYTCTANILSASVADSATNANVAAALAMSGPGMLCSGTAAIGIQANGEPICASSITATALNLTADPADCSGNQWARGITSTGAASCAQPGFGNLSGTVALSQITDHAQAGWPLISGGALGDPTWGTIHPAMVEDDAVPGKVLVSGGESGSPHWSYAYPELSAYRGLDWFGATPPRLGIMECGHHDVLQSSDGTWQCRQPEVALARGMAPCAAGEFLTCDGTTCVCAVPPGGGSGGQVDSISIAESSASALTVGGTPIEPELGLTTVCASGSVLKWDGTGWGCAPDETSGVAAVTAAAPLASSGGATPEISLQPCTDSGQVLRWSGTTWQCVSLPPPADVPTILSGVATLEISHVATRACETVVVTDGDAASLQPSTHVVTATRAVDAHYTPIDFGGSLVIAASPNAGGWLDVEVCNYHDTDDAYPSDLKIQWIAHERP